MKKFNMNELYKIAGEKNGGKGKEETKAADAEDKGENKESESKNREGSGTAGKTDEDGSNTPAE